MLEDAAGGRGDVLACAGFLSRGGEGNIVDLLIGLMMVGVSF